MKWQKFNFATVLHIASYGAIEILMPIEKGKRSKGYTRLKVNAPLPSPHKKRAVVNSAAPTIT